MFFVKTNCGNEAEMMLEQVLKNGYITASEVIIKTYKRIEQSPCMYIYIYILNFCFCFKNNYMI